MKIDGLPVIDVDESEEITVAVRADDLLEGVHRRRGTTSFFYDAHTMEFIGILLVMVNRARFSGDVRSRRFLSFR